MFSCPACGRPESSHDGETFCGSCERRYHEEQDRFAREEIAQLQAEINACPYNNEEYCMRCTARYARILSLQGDEAGAIAMMNR